MDTIQDSDTFNPAPQNIKKDKGKWRTKKTPDGKTKRFKLFGKGKTGDYGPSKTAYTNAYSAQKTSYMEYQFDGDMGAYTTALANILSGGNTGVQEYQLMLSYLNGIHQTILKGMNLETFHDLMLSNPRIEKYLLTNGFSVKDATGKTVPLTNLKVFDGSSISGTVNIVSTGQGGDLFSIGRLEVIPVTDKIYMSLSSKGGFYYREGDILIPFDRLTEQGFLEEVGTLKSQAFVAAVKSTIGSFNQQILTLDASGVAAPGMRVGADGLMEGSSTDTLRGVAPGNTPGVMTGIKDKENNGDGKGGDRDQHISVTSMLNTGNRLREFQNALKASPVLYGRMTYNGFAPSDKDKGAIARFFNALDTYSLITGTNYTSILDVLDDSNPSDSENDKIDEFFDFARNYYGGRRNQTLSNLIRAFMMANNIPPGSNVIPDDPDQFYQKIIASNDPSVAIYKSQWQNFVSPDNAKNVSALYNLVAGGNPGYNQYSQATGNAGNNAGSARSSRSDSSLYDAYGNLKTKKNTQKDGSKWGSSGDTTDKNKSGASNKWETSGGRIYADEEISKMKVNQNNKNAENSTGSKFGFGSSETTSSKLTKWGNASSGSAFSGGGDGDFATSIKNAALKGGRSKYDLQARIRNELQISDKSQIDSALRMATDEVNSYLIKSKASEASVEQFISDYVANGNPVASTYFSNLPNNEGRYIDGEKVLNAFAHGLGVYTSAGNADFDAYRTVD